LYHDYEDILPAFQCVMQNDNNGRYSINQYEAASIAKSGVYC